MSWHPGQAVALRAHRRGPGHLLAALAALVFLCQLPGPATCLKLAWRFTALPLPSVESESEPREAEPTPEPEATTAPRIEVPTRPLVSADGWRVVLLLPPSPVLEAGTTRAPPLG
jgi:hypothetical protein